jgi:hypothetical protein
MMDARANGPEPGARGEPRDSSATRTRFCRTGVFAFLMTSLVAEAERDAISDSSTRNGLYRTVGVARQPSGKEQLRSRSRSSARSSPGRSALASPCLPARSSTGSHSRICRTCRTAMS